jgi:bifunctional DNase/RNase
MSEQPTVHIAPTDDPNAEIEVRIRGLMLDPVTNMPIVVLKDVLSDAVLPIWVGVFEANAIALEIEKSTAPRPMTHDLLRNLIGGLNAVVRKIVVSELKSDTYYAHIWMEQHGELVTIDSRPSDALALALRCDVPIYVLRRVLQKARVSADGPQNLTAEELRKTLENLNDEDLGRYKM